MTPTPPLTPAQTRQILFGALAHDWERSERDRVWKAVDPPDSSEKQSPSATRSATVETLPREYLFYI